MGEDNEGEEEDGVRGTRQQKEAHTTRAYSLSLAFLRGGS